MSVMTKDAYHSATASGKLFSMNPQKTVTTLRLWCEIVNVFVWVAVVVSLSIAGVWHTSLRWIVEAMMGLVAGSSISFAWQAWKFLRKRKVTD